MTYKVGWSGRAITYVDGFAGPWNAQADDLSDTSPMIAIAELTGAQTAIGERGRVRPRIRCIFVEKNRAASELLRKTVAALDGVEATVIHGRFERHIPDIIKHVSGSFGFFFIDPKGWTRFGMRTVEPILQHSPGEVLINFQTPYISRFVDKGPDRVAPSFEDLFGSSDFRDQWRGLSGLDREDAIVRTYCDRVKTVGRFPWVVSTPILHPTDNRTGYHLVYATRHVEGLRTFKGAEKTAFKAQISARAMAQQTRRNKREESEELFGAEEFGDGGHCLDRRNRYLALARQQLLGEVKSRGVLSYDALEQSVTQNPLVWESDVKEWLQSECSATHIRILGMTTRQKGPSRGAGHTIEYIPQAR